MIDPIPQRLLNETIEPAIDAVLADGQTWRLPFRLKSRLLDDYRDRIADAFYGGSGTVSSLDVRMVVMALLRCAYILDVHEARALTDVDDDQLAQLAETVRQLIVGPELDKQRTGYSEYLRTAFAANGLDLAKTDQHDIPGILAQLIATGRALPPERFLTSAINRAKRQELLG